MTKKQGQMLIEIVNRIECQHKRKLPGCNVLSTKGLSMIVLRHLMAAGLIKIETMSVYGLICFPTEDGIKRAKALKTKLTSSQAYFLQVIASFGSEGGLVYGYRWWSDDGHRLSRKTLDVLRKLGFVTSHHEGWPYRRITATITQEGLTYLRIVGKGREP